MRARPGGQARLTLMHGFADYASALLWIQAEQDGPLTVTWRARDGTERRATPRRARRTSASHSFASPTSRRARKFRTS